MTKVRPLLLAAGLGTRLRPLTEFCPKCLVPIGGIPLLEHWLCNLHRLGIRDAWVNVHHHQDLVTEFLGRANFAEWVHPVYEPTLLGTAGTVRANADKLSHDTTFLIHADNWCQCNFSDFVEFHCQRRPARTLMTMMTFRTLKPQACGIVAVDADGVVTDFYEKVPNPPSNLANGAVYLIEPDVVQWIKKRTEVTDFSTHVIPEFLGRIATWENTEIHRDIGVIGSLLEAQGDLFPEPCWRAQDEWTRKYQKHSVHRRIGNALSVETST